LRLLEGKDVLLRAIDVASGTINRHKKSPP